MMPGQKKKIGFRVFGEAELICYIEEGRNRFNHCISIRDPGHDIPQAIGGHFRHLLELEFWDVEGLDAIPSSLRFGVLPEVARLAETGEALRENRNRLR